MDFGLNFFPSIGPDKKSAADYFRESLDLAALADELGYGHIRTVEHYFEAYGGYSPNPVVFLSAAAQRTKTARLVTGAMLPIFNNPLKMAGEIGMLDAISNGRLDIGFARAFLPHEFDRFGRSLDESRRRFNEGLEQVKLLLTTEHASSDGEFFSFHDVTSLPRPTQLPHPPIWIATFTTEESFRMAGENGYNIMGIPFAGEKMGQLMGIYRDAWKSAGHKGEPRMMLSFAMYCAETTEAALAIGRPALNGYLKALGDAAAAWGEGASTKDYPGYDKMVASIRAETFESQREKGVAWVGTPDEIADMIADFRRSTGPFESASMQVNFYDIPAGEAAPSMRLFAKHVMPRFSS